MTYPPHALVQFGGTLDYEGAGDEIWNCGVRVVDLAGGGFIDCESYLADVHTTLRAWFADDSSSGMAAQAQLEFLKVNNIDAAGHYNDPDTHEYIFSPPAPGARSGQLAPAFTSVCFSWRAIAARGYATHGRIYPPNFTYQPVGSHISDTDVTFAKASALKLLQLLQNADGDQACEPVIVSRIGSVLNPITRYGVGNVYDFISKRKNAAPETYSFSAL